MHLMRLVDRLAGWPFEERLIGNFFPLRYENSLKMRRRSRYLPGEYITPRFPYTILNDKTWI